MNHNEWGTVIGMTKPPPKEGIRSALFSNLHTSLNRRKDTRPVKFPSYLKLIFHI